MGSRRDLSCVKSIRMRFEMWAGGAPILLLGADRRGETIAANRQQELARYGDMGPGIDSYRDQRNTKPAATNKLFWWLFVEFAKVVK